MPMSSYDQAGAGKSPEEHMQTGCHAAVHAVLEDDELDAAGKSDKIRAILTAHEKLVGKLGGNGDDEPADKPGVVERIARLLKLGKGQRRLSERVRPVRTPRELAVRLFGRGHVYR